MPGGGHGPSQAQRQPPVNPAAVNLMSGKVSAHCILTLLLVLGVGQCTGCDTALDCVTYQSWACLLVSVLLRRLVDRHGPGHGNENDGLPVLSDFTSITMQTCNKGGFPCVAPGAWQAYSCMYS
eukprot:1152375-Pelagomonas_calceolata.AAC.4